MLQKLSEEIRECLSYAEECRRQARTALNPDVIRDYLDMEQRWLALARSYGFTERPSTFVQPFRREDDEDDKETPRPGTSRPISVPDEYARPDERALLIEADQRFQTWLHVAIAAGQENIDAVKATVKLRQRRTKLPR